MDLVQQSEGWKRRLSRRLFGRGRWYFTIGEFIGSIGLICTLSDVYGRFSEWKKIPPIDNLNYFLWVFGAWTWATFALVLVVWRKTYADMKDSDRELGIAKARLDRATDLTVKSTRILHHMAEEVRKCAKVPEKFDCSRELQQIFRQLQDHLQICHSILRVSITVKVFQDGKLTAAFRDDGQNRGDDGQNRGIVGEATELGHSYAYRTFGVERDHHDKKPKKFALARDTELLPASEEAYKGRARQLNFRSVLAFPLRYPAPNWELSGRTLDDFKVSSLFGFLSFDASSENAFDPLFVGPEKKTEWQNDGTNLQLGIDSDLYYGIADSVATVLMLSKKVSIPKTEKPHG